MLRLRIGIGGFNHPTEKALYDFTATFKASLFALAVNYCLHLIAQVNGERFFIANACHKSLIGQLMDANTRQKETPAEGRG